MNLSKFKVKEISANSNKAVVATDTTCKINITAVSGKTLEIWVDFDGNGERNKSYSIEKFPEVTAEITVADKGEYYLVSAGKAAVCVYKNGIRLVFVNADDSIVCEVKEIGRDENGAVFMSHVIADCEHIYGLGEDNDAYLGNLDRRGTTRDMITGQKINIGKVTADIPVTFYMSTGSGKPYGIFTDNSYPMFYDIGKGNPDECYQKALGGDMIFYFFNGDNFGDILNEYTNLTGKPPMPPLWTLGYIQCRCSYWNWEQVDGLIDTLRKHHIPLDCIVFDYDWAECFNNYKWNKRWEGKSPEKIAEYRKQGLHFMVSNSGPMLKKDSDTFESALEANVLARDTDGSTITCGHYGGELIDFSHPNTKEWLRPQLERILDDGVESWWLDLTEPEGDPENTVYYDGDRNKVHNPFSLLNTKTYNDITKEHCPEMRPFILTRTGTAGIQKYCTAIWSGDVYSDYKTFSAHIPEAMNTGMSGIPLWTSDAGGFISSTSNANDNRNIYKNDVARHANLYERWVQFACFCPVMRVHHAGESAPFAFGELMTDSVAHYIRLRYRLLPYIYSYAYRTHLTGEPIMRPLVYNYPSDEQVYDIKDEFMFGDEILVAPVHEEEVCKRQVYLPEGKWYDFDYGYEYEGGQSYEVYAPQNRIPVFVKSGAIISVSEQIYNTAELDNRVIAAEIYPDGTSRFTLYADDGKSVNYEKDMFTITEITCEETAGEKTVIKTARSNNLFAADKIKLKIHVNAVPKSVSVNGKNLDSKWLLHLLEKSENSWHFEEFSRKLYITAELDDAENEIVIEYENVLIRKPSKSEENENLCGQSPYILPAASVPCKMAFENFDRGGEGVAYHKHSPENEDGIYRNDSVCVRDCDDIGCGYCVKNTVAGEWLEYTVNVLKEGMYSFRLRACGNGVVSISANQREVVTDLKVACEKWQDISSDKAHLVMGEQTIRIFVTEGRIDGNYFEIDKS